MESDSQLRTFCEVSHLTWHLRVPHVLEFTVEQFVFIYIFLEEIMCGGLITA